MPKQKEPMRGEICQTIEGASVTILAKVGDAYRVLNENGRIELVYPNQIKSSRGETH